MRLNWAVGFASALLFMARTAGAAQYEVLIDIETEEDLYELLLAEQISEPSFDALLLLLQTRVDLNRGDRQRLYLLPNLDYAQVDRILAYRGEVGAIRSLEELSAAGVLEAELLDTLRAFIILRGGEAPRSQTDGFVRIQGQWSGRSDRLPPASGIQARIQTLGDLDLGMAVALTRNRLRRVRWDPIRGALSAEPEQARLELPKLYAAWTAERWKLIVGTYRIGFGQGLTFDVTDQVSPNGFFGDYELRRGSELSLRCRRARGELRESPCPSDPVARVSPDFDWTNRLAGAAIGLKELPLGQGWVQAYAWGSYQVHRISQFELAETGACEDPRRNEDPTCSSPLVYIREGDPSAAASTATFATLPAMYAEGLAGANLSYFWNERAHLGFTGYGAAPRWLVDGVELGFQESSRKPFGGPFGAIGVDAAFGVGVQDLFVELARSFDSQLGGRGGFGAIARSVTTLPMAELDISARYYAPSYANPYARPVSAADELEGLRARDEAGLRARATVRPGPRVSIRVLADAWRSLSSRIFGSQLFLRSELRLPASWALAFWLDYRRGVEQRASLATELSYDPLRRISLSGQVQYRFAGTRFFRDGAQQDTTAIFSLTTRPVEALRLRFRLRYDFEDLWDKHRLPQILWSYADVAITLRERDRLRLRYDFRVFLDQRESTRVRVPNPEHWLWLEYVFRY